MRHSIESAATASLARGLSPLTPHWPAAPGTIAPAAMATWAVEGPPTAKAPPRRLRILVVEDEPIIAMLLGELLGVMGHDVCGIVGDEAGAVAAAAFHKPDLMIVDATLGAGSGVRAVETVTSAGPSPHLFTSGDALAVQRQKPGALVLQKPYNETELADAIRRALQ